MPRQDNQILAKYLSDGNVDLLKEALLFKQNFKDGRSSVAMVKLIAAARELSVDLFGFDEATYNEQQIRDTVMAENIRSYASLYPSKRIVVLAGNIHTRLSTLTLDSNEIRPMLYELVHLHSTPISISNVSNFNLQYATGSMWNCRSNAVGASECRIYDNQNVKSVYSEAVPYAFYGMLSSEMSDGYLGVVFARSVSASVPFLPQK